MLAKRRTGARLPDPQGPQGHPNFLLAALPPDELARVQRSLDVVDVKLRQLLHKPGDRIEHVYFPGGGFCSMLTVLEDGRMVEVATRSIPVSE